MKFITIKTTRGKQVEINNYAIASVYEERANICNIKMVNGDYYTVREGFVDLMNRIY